MSPQIILYSRKLSREKVLQIGEKYDVRGENFCGLLAFAVPKDATLPNFTEKTFVNSHKTAVFSLKSFPLYGMKQKKRESIKLPTMLVA